MEIEAFFNQIKPINDWIDIEAHDAYQEVPDDWWILMTDIKGSTSAIHSGRYKEVNTLGVCAIISVQNVLKTDLFPFIFGGDGATLLVSDSKKEQALQALSYTRQVAKDQFGFELRVFSIQVSELKKKMKSIQVAVLENKDKQRVFLFKGGGITLAESLMKKDSSFELPTNYPQQGSHEGLECRWNPVPSNRGSIISFIINPLSENNLIENLLVDFQHILKSAQPIKASSIPVSWPPRHLPSEAKAKGKGFFFKLKILLYILLLFPLIKLGRNSKGSAVDIYLHQLQDNTDFVKRDDSLRLVVDLTAAEKDKILKKLNDLQDQGQISFGYHESPKALMTCMVRSASNHFHFVDGSDGGYTRAAIMLKNSKKTS